MSEFALLVCSLLLSVHPPASGIDTAVAIDTCGDVVDVAWSADVPVALVAALGYHESKYDPFAVSRSGALGPLQVLPVYSCPGGRARGCDVVAAGVGALRRFLVRADWDRSAAVCRYTGCRVTGNTGFVAQILATTRWIERSLECQCSTPRVD